MLVEDLEELKGKYMAVLTVPAFFVGSEIEPSEMEKKRSLDRIFRYSSALSLETGIPLISFMMSRSSESCSNMNHSLIYGGEERNRFFEQSGEGRFLVVVEKEQPTTEEEQRLVLASDKLQDWGNVELRAIDSSQLRALF